VKLYFCQKSGFWAIILALDLLESQSRTLKTQITGQFSKKPQPKNGSMGWHPGTGKLGQKYENMPSLWCHPQKTQNEKLFFQSALEDLLNP